MLRLLLFALLLSSVCQAQLADEPVPWYWFSAAYGTPVLTNSTFYDGGFLEIKVGGRITSSNITVVGGLENSLASSDSALPERFSLFFGPGYMFKDERIFFSIHTGLSYPFYRNAPDYQQDIGLHTSLDVGVRVAPKFTLGVGLSNQLAKDVQAFAIRFWVQLNTD